MYNNIQLNNQTYPETSIKTQTSQKKIISIFYNYHEVEML